jgi:hypothetical protein
MHRDLAQGLKFNVVQLWRQNLVHHQYMRLDSPLFQTGPATIKLTRKEPSRRRVVGTCMEAGSEDTKTNVLRRIGSQPVALAAGALVVVVLAASSMGLWRAYTGNSPEQERLTSLRQMQVRATQASEQLFEKTKGLETSQQQTIDQLQTVQEQLQALKRLVAAQQADAKRLSEQVGGLTGAIDTLRQSFASAQSAEPSDPPATRKSSVRSQPRATKPRHAGVHRKRAKS